jgi:hypothetical protein
MGLLSKTNPAASRESVIRHATIFGGVVAIGYPIACWLVSGAGLCAHWPVLYPLFIILGSALGGLMHWQMLDIIYVEEIVKEVEEEFDIRIDEARIKEIETVEDLLNAVLDATGSQHPEERQTESGLRESVLARLRKLIVEQMCVDADEVVLSARFYYELQ